MTTSPAGQAGSLVLDAEALYRELLRGVRSMLTPTTRLAGIASGGAWLAERLQKDLGLEGPAGVLSSVMHRDDFAQRGLAVGVEGVVFPDGGGISLLLGAGSIKAKLTFAPAGDGAEEINPHALNCQRRTDGDHRGDRGFVDGGQDQRRVALQFGQFRLQRRVLGEPRGVLGGVLAALLLDRVQRVDNCCRRMFWQLHHNFIACFSFSQYQKTVLRFPALSFYCVHFPVSKNFPVLYFVRAVLYTFPCGRSFLHFNPFIVLFSFSLYWQIFVCEFKENSLINVSV